MILALFLTLDSEWGKEKVHDGKLLNKSLFQGLRPFFTQNLMGELNLNGNCVAGDL